MKAAVILVAMFAVALGAPLSEKAEMLDVEGEDMRVKRAKEIMMFGNQQNEQQKDKAKRSDPSEEIDKNGYIVAKEPVDLETEDTDEEPASTGIEEEATPDIANEESGVVDTVTADQDQDTVSDDGENEETEESTAVESVDSDSGQMSIEDYLKELENLQAETNYFPQYFNKKPRVYNQYPYYSPYNYQRYRRSQVRAFSGYQFPRSRVLKRAHRAKRQAFYVPEMQGYLPYDDGLDSQYKYPVTEEDLTELLDILDDARTYDDSVYMNPYEEYEPYDDEVGNIEFESPIYVPKRQAGLTFVPGIKRNPDFYPYFNEPESHYAAFVPDKRSIRDYADAYQRVMELAAALRQQNYYPDEYLEGYRRRK